MRRRSGRRARRPVRRGERRRPQGWAFSARGDPRTAARRRGGVAVRRPRCARSTWTATARPSSSSAHPTSGAARCASASVHVRLRRRAASVASAVNITEGDAGPAGGLSSEEPSGRRSSSFDGCRFGRALAALLDLDGDGVPRVSRRRGDRPQRRKQRRETRYLCAPGDRSSCCSCAPTERCDGTRRLPTASAGSLLEQSVKDIGGSLATLTLDGAVTLVASSQATNPPWQRPHLPAHARRRRHVTAQREVRPAAANTTTGGATTRSRCCPTPTGRRTGTRGRRLERAFDHPANDRGGQAITTTRRCTSSRSTPPGLSPKTPKSRGAAGSLGPTSSLSYFGRMLGRGRALGRRRAHRP